MADCRHCFSGEHRGAFLQAGVPELAAADGWETGMPRRRARNAAPDRAQGRQLVDGGCLPAFDPLVAVGQLGVMAECRRSRAGFFLRRCWFVPCLPPRRYHSRLIWRTEETPSLVNQNHATETKIQALTTARSFTVTWRAPILGMAFSRYWRPWPRCMALLVELEIERPED